MKKRFLNYLVLAVSVFLLFFCVGCNDSVENNDGTGYVTFTEESSSRSLHTGGESAVDPENLVWAYVAVKKDGLHTVGASVVATSATAGKTELVDGINYVLKPVKEDFSKGLNIEVGPFSWGEWKFVLYAYEKCVSGVFTNLVYTASTLETFTTLNPLESGKTSVPVLLKFVNGSGYPSTGTLELGDISLIVPQGMKFYSGKTVSVSFTDTASPAITAFTGMATVPTGDAEAGTEIPLTFATTQFNNVAVGAHILKIEVKYDGAQITTAGAFTYTVLVKKGDVVNLYGDVTDLKMTSGSDTNTVFSTAVCRLGDVEYASLAEALAATTSSNYTIHLLRNVDYGGVATGFYGTSASGNVVIVMDGYYVKNLTIPHTLLTTSETVKMVAFVPNDTLSSTVRYPYGVVDSVSGDFDAVADFFYIQSEGTNFNAWMKFTDGYLNAGGLTAGNSYIYGRLNYLNIGAGKDVANNIGAHIYCDVYGTASSAVGLYKGYFEFGDDIRIAKTAYASTFTSANSVVVGKPTTRIDNLTPSTTGVIKRITLNGNGVSAISGANTVVYGIEGTRVKLPKIEETFNRTGWVCRWNTKSDGTGSDIEDDGHTLVIHGDSTLYAIWEMNCLCFTTTVAGNTIGMTKVGSAPNPNLKYSTDGGVTWNVFTPGTTTVSLASVGDKVFFRGSGCTASSSANYNKFTATQNFNASGSIMSLIDGKGNTTTLKDRNYAFYYLFGDCSKLLSIPELPATELASYCYGYMFYNCDGLTNLWNNTLPAETIPDHAYIEMFGYCDGITHAPLIAAKKVSGSAALYGVFHANKSLANIQDQIFIQKGEADKGYTDTFRGFINSCAKLTKLPAFYGVTVLGERDFMDAFPYNSMLNSVRVGFTDWGGDATGTNTPTYRWLLNAPATGTFYCPAGLDTSVRNGNRVPAGWTVVIVQPR